MSHKTDTLVLHKPWIRFLVAFLLTLSLPNVAAAQPIQPQPVTPTPTTAAKVLAAPEAGHHELSRADLETFLDGFVPYALKNGDIAGVTIAVVKDGQVLLKKGYGFANVKTKRPMDPDTTLVRVGSTSKLFTWTAVMQLVEQGKLDLDRDINDYLDFKINSSFSKPITLRNLMTHRAGFEEGLKSILVTDPKALISTEQYLKADQRPVLYPPGEVPAYSNYGAALAGYIVQRVSGEPFESYVEHHILSPLAMTRSTFRQPVPATLNADVAEGYLNASEPPRPFEFIVTAPAGSMSATADDMAKFMIAYLQRGQFQENRILKPETVRLMWEPAVQQIANLNVMALGFFEENRNGRRVRGHGGDTIVFHTALDLFIDDGVGIFMSFNSRGTNDSIYGVRQGLFDAFADRYFPNRSQASVPAGDEPGSHAQLVAGRYESPRKIESADPRDHAQLIAGRYESSRRVESAFISVLYLLSQTVITANKDGSINVPTFPSEKPKRYVEVAPFVWAEAEGQHKVALVGEGGHRTIYNSDDPSSALQPVPWWKAGPWNLTLLCFSIATLLFIMLAWPVSSFLRWKYGQQSTASKRDLLVLRVLRVAALIDLLYLAAWIGVLSPILNNQIEAYGTSLDPYIRSLQLAGFLVIVAAVAGVWVACQRGKKWSRTIWHVLTAVALVGIVWIGFITKLIGFNLNY